MEVRYNEQLQLCCPSSLRVAGRVMQAGAVRQRACMTLPATLSDDGQDSCSCSLCLASTLRSPCSLAGVPAKVAGTSPSQRPAPPACSSVSCLPWHRSEQWVAPYRLRQVRTQLWRRCAQAAQGSGPCPSRASAWRRGCPRLVCATVQVVQEHGDECTRRLYLQTRRARCAHAIPPRPARRVGALSAGARPHRRL